MPEILVQIDLDSIKPNPRAGESIFYVPGVMRSNGSRSVQPMHTLGPAPAWLFTFLPTEVECENCHEKFPHSKLEDTTDWDSDEDGDYETGCEFTCPFCKEDCGNTLRYEHLSDARKRSQCS
jgi:hypothetical protein